MYRSEIANLANWCSVNNLELNVNKTKEVIVDFRKGNMAHSPISINDRTVEIVSVFKFLGIQLSNCLSWQTNTDYLVKKAQQRLYFLRRLKKIGMSNSILVNFYRSVIESILTYAITVWFNNITKDELNSLERVVRTAQRIIGTELPSLHSIYQTRTMHKAKAIIQDFSHPAYDLFKLLPSGKRYRAIRTRTERFRKSFYPSAIRILNRT